MWDARFEILEGEILTDSGLSQQVLTLLRPEVASTPDDNYIAIRSRTLCALAYARLGQSAQSDQELREAQSLSNAHGSELDAQIALTKGLIDLHFDRFSSAESWFEKALEISRQRGDKFLESDVLVNLGTVAVRIEHYDEAMRRFGQASNLAQAIHADSTSELALGNQGWAYYKMGDFEKSAETFQQAENQAEHLGSLQYQILWLTDAGLSLYQSRDLAAAEGYYGKAMKAAEVIDDRDLIGEVHLELGFLCLQRGQLAQAQEHSEEALKASQALENPSAEDEPLFLSALIAARQHKPEARDLLMQVYKRPELQPSLRWRVENAIANQYAETNQSYQADLWYQRSIQTFETERSTLNGDEQRLPFFANADVLYKDYADYLIRSHRENEALQLLDAARARTLEEGLKVVTARSASLRGLQADPRATARKLNSTILFYSLGEPKSYLWSIDAKSVHIFQLPAQSEIENSVSNYQKAILASADPLHSNDEARNLYDMLVAPAASRIAAGSRVIVIPDGGLNLLNFETLIAGKDKAEHYWIEDVTLTNASSIRLLAASSAVTPSPGLGKLLLIGDAIPAAPEYAPLENASVEVNSVEEHFLPASRTVITQSRAVPEAYFASSPGQFSYIHFVAHATASRLSPLDSAVVLSPTPDHPDTYKLYARDIVHQPLHAELVTISSCYGSGSRAYAGEGMVGLSWAFLRAGSHHVIAALWEADDASTAKLMDRLYTGLGSGERPDTALRNAKLALIHTAGVYRKPYYWAAFQLQSGS